MPEHFVNDGFGWECKRCRETQEGAGDVVNAATLPRFFREGEAEEREPRLSEGALARWKDSERRALVCPRCGAEEVVS